MAIDPSIPLSTNSGGNLLQTLGQATQLRGQMQSQRSNMALSRILQQSVDPATGQVDYNKVQSLAAQDPDAAYNLPTLQGQILQQKTNQLEFDTKQLDQAAKRTGYVANGLGGLLASGDITPSAVMKIAASGIAQGLFSSQDAMNVLSDMPNDPAQLQNWVKQKYVGFSEDTDRLKTLMPTTQTINTGAQQVVASIDPLTGQPTGRSTVFNNQLTPEAASQPTQIFDPATGTMRQITREQFANAAVGAGQGGMPQQYLPDTSGGSLGTGRLQPITGGGAPGLQSSPALGSAEAAQVVGKGAAEASLALQRQADAAPQSIYQFQNMREKLADINTGPGTDWRNTAQAFITGLSPDIAAKIGIDPQKIASAEEFKKYATQATQATLASLGEGTDSKLASAAAANPGTQLSKLGNQQLIDVLIAGQRAIAAKNSAWQASGLPPEQFNRFSSQWNKEIDPRVFAAQDMSNDQVWKMVDSLTKREQDAFMNSWNKAQQLGYVQ
jgi:hypothetical protein